MTRRASGTTASSSSPVPHRSRPLHPAGEQHTLLRALPSVDELTRAMRSQPSRVAAPEPPDSQASEDIPENIPHEALVRAARAALAEARDAIAGNEPRFTRDTLVARALALLADARRPSLRRVINATGVIVNTNLGRAPLSAAALAAMQAVAQGYSNLEYDLDRGERGSRQTPVRALLRELTGAEDALVVNNNAAAVLVVLAALAAGREVIVSRGELVEIGGGFRVPDVMRQSGARLVEVGTTNRTRIRDFETAIAAETGLLLAVHPSNFRIVGFTEAPDLAALAACAHTHDLPLVHDLGSGCLYDTTQFGLAHEPTVRESVAASVDVVCFSGDKLLGGPQAGIIAGRARYIERIERHPLMRAMRIDKLTLAALEATLRAHRDGLAEREIPVWRMIATPLEDVHTRAARWAATIRSWRLRAEVREGQSTVGGGSLPGETLPTHHCALGGATSDDASQTSIFDVEVLAARLRQGNPAVVGRVYRGQLLLDPRTVSPDEDDLLLDALQRAIADV